MVLDAYRSESTSAQARLLDKAEQRKAELLAAALPVFHLLRRDPRDLGLLTRHLAALARGGKDWQAVYRQACAWLPRNGPPPPSVATFEIEP